jgi:hypothetical protein
MTHETQHGTWWLDDAEAKNAESPSSFFIPPAVKRNSLVPGDKVKLLFAFEPTPEGRNGERMWVEVTSVRGDTYVGRLLNQPQHIETLTPGSEIEFAPHHVAGYDWDPAELGYDASQHAWVSKDVVRGMDRPLLVTMRPPENISDESDSGWTVGNGDEPDAGPTHFEWSAVGWLTDRFPELELVFRAGGGSWRWDSQQGQYVRASE